MDVIYQEPSGLTPQKVENRGKISYIICLVDDLTRTAAGGEQQYEMPKGHDP
jgi:hypothetical protein